ncbi:hypothetical protein GQ43DRAFT_271241 [Delitschia confertaspora ATCC 74209]|uniref:Uncharacterized protein n=1 Tax=Delitschia confertaspora ATCC 74209 TaxID=1513339 RepID=A0A9P4JPK0_9PLEO|nr:hypothetical protein GQ43DRAFT_271241 [Delitschia confertaspora ATCC 74209]
MSRSPLSLTCSTERLSSSLESCEYQQHMLDGSGTARFRIEATFVKNSLRWYGSYRCERGFFDSIPSLAETRFIRSMSFLHGICWCRHDLSSRSRAYRISMVCCMSQPIHSYAKRGFIRPLGSQPLFHVASHVFFHISSSQHDCKRRCQNLSHVKRWA